MYIRYFSFYHNDVCLCKVYMDYYGLIIIDYGLLWIVEEKEARVCLIGVEQLMHDKAE